MKTLGIIGGGQLGRMLAMAAARLSIRTIILEPQTPCPAGQVANDQIVAAYDDELALAELARRCDWVTYEFENVPVQAAEFLATLIEVCPPPKALAVSQDRLVEKRFLNDCAIPTAGFRAIDSQADLVTALAEFGGRGVLKTRRMGYDGKGQMMFRSPADPVAGAYAALGSVPMILESLVDFEREISVIAVRDRQGGFAAYDPAENVHRSGILHTSTLPAHVKMDTAQAAVEAARRLMDGLSYVGVIGMEFFVMADGSLVANEIAPRVHNSGHWTEAACTVSQFDNHVRAVAGLSLGSTRRHSDCIMTNLIGHDVDRLGEWLAREHVLVHLYGKEEARAGRKMGHVTELTGAAGD